MIYLTDFKLQILTSSLMHVKCKYIGHCKIVFIIIKRNSKLK